MGLDMYIEAVREVIVEDKYFSHYMLNDEKLKENEFSYDPDLSELEKDIFDRNFKSYRKTILESYQIGYFRKFNALHNFIVNKFADGVDECQRIELAVYNLDILLDTLKQVAEDHTKAHELLPTCSGFFFGTTEYDEWYFKDVDYAIRLFTKAKKLLELNKDWTVIYQASW